MKPDDIEVGKTYRNRGKGKTSRTVLEISEDLPAPLFSRDSRPGDVVVRYIQDGMEGTLYLASFAAWCGSVA